jgi:hypothetical protein
LKKMLVFNSVEKVELRLSRFIYTRRQKRQLRVDIDILS